MHDPNATTTTGIGAAAQVELPAEFLHNLGDGMADGELTAEEALCSDDSDCVDDVCAGNGDTCSTAAAALFNTLAEGIANNMNMAAGYNNNCWLEEPVPDGCIDPSEILVTDLTTGRRRMLTEGHATMSWHTYCLDKRCTAAV